MVLRLHFEALRGALEAEHGEVDTIQFDGQKASLADVLDELRSLALLQRHKLVVVGHRGSLYHSSSGGDASVCRGSG